MARSKGNSPLYRFPRSNSTSSTSSTESTGSSSAGLVSPTLSTASSFTDSDYDKEVEIRDDIRATCIGKQYCKCMTCYGGALGDFIFETQEEFEVYFEILKDVVAKQADGTQPIMHCHAVKH